MFLINRLCPKSLNWPHAILDSFSLPFGKRGEEKERTALKSRFRTEPNLSTHQDTIISYTENNSFILMRSSRWVFLDSFPTFLAAIAFRNVWICQYVKNHLSETGGMLLRIYLLGGFWAQINAWRLLCNKPLRFICMLRIFPDRTGQSSLCH